MNQQTNPFWQVNALTESKDGKWYAGTALVIQGVEQARDFVYEMPFAEETSALVWAEYLKARLTQGVQMGMISAIAEKGLLAR